jgi:hypothetical protein
VLAKRRSRRSVRWESTEGLYLQVDELERCEGYLGYERKGLLKYSSVVLEMEEPQPFSFSKEGRGKMRVVGGVK